MELALDCLVLVLLSQDIRIPRPVRMAVRPAHQDVKSLLAVLKAISSLRRKAPTFLPYVFGRNVSITPFVELDGLA